MTQSTPTVAPPPLFRKSAEGRVQLRYGDIATLSEMTGWSRSSLSRGLAAPHDAHPALRIAVEQIVGVPLEQIDRPRSRRIAA